MEIHQSTEKIRVRAHQLWEQAGRPHGHDLEHWLQAEKEFLLNSAAPEALMKEPSGAESRPAKKPSKGAKKTSGRSKAKQPL